MPEKINLGSCTLVHSEKDDFLDKEVNFLKRAYELNKNFATINVPKFTVRLVYSRKELDEVWGSKNPDYVPAFVKNGEIALLAYSCFDKESRWKREDFFPTLIHEINHLFYQELRNDSYDPLWLSEGLATFMQTIEEKENVKHESKIKKGILEQDFEDMNLKSYEVFAMFVNFLIRKYGKDKILELIKGLKSGKPLKNLFQNLYNKKYKELITEGNKYYGTV